LGAEGRGAALALLLVALPAAARADGPWTRWHFVLGPDAELSVLFRREKTGDETRLLVRALAGRFELVSRQSLSGRDSVESVRSLEEEETLTRRLVLGGHADEPACSGVPPKDACVVLTGRSGTLASGLSAFAGEGVAALREEAAALVSPAMKRRLVELAPALVGTADYDAYAPDFLTLLWPETYGPRAPLKRGTRTRGCDFDAGFGHPCSPAEREREEKRFGPSKP
jgi:hypothetical protein